MKGKCLVTAIRVTSAKGWAAKLQNFAVEVSERLICCLALLWSTMRLRHGVGLWERLQD